MVTIADTGRVQELLDSGAQVIEVLPQSAWRQEHLPGALSIPLPEMRADSVSDLDFSKPTVVYCYDHECDLSSRGAALLEVLGFTEVYDYSDSKTAWVGCGLPAEGDIRDDDRVGTRAKRPPTCKPDAMIGDVADSLRDAEVLLIVTDDDVVVGALHPRAASLPADTNVLLAADPGPASVRPSMTRFELAESMEKDQQTHVVVSTSVGVLLGIVTREDLR